MNMTKTMIRFYTVADFKEEEIWLRSEHKSGWRLIKMTPPCFYLFEECTPEDMIYRLDYKNNTQTEEYMQMMQDFGWEYAGKFLGWIYFRKPAEAISDKNEGEIYSNNESRITMLQSVVRTRMLPLAIIFCACVIPNAARAFDSRFSAAFTVFWAIILCIYIWLLTYCGLKLKKMKNEINQDHR